MKKTNKTSLKKIFKREFELLKNIELNELDFKESGQWPMLIKLIFMTITFSAIMFIGNNVHIENLKSRHKTEITKESTLLKDISKYSFVRPTIIDYREQLATLTMELESIKQKLPEKIEMSPILDELTQLAIQSNVIIDSINLEDEKIQENYIDLPFKINAKGKFHAFAAFLSELAKMNRIVTVHDVVIKLGKDKESTMLEMQFIAKTYKYYTPDENIEGGKK
jgi:type IV pilus assembly protein PilO